MKHNITHQSVMHKDNFIDCTKYILFCIQGAVNVHFGITTVNTFERSEFLLFGAKVRNI